MTAKPNFNRGSASRGTRRQREEAARRAARRARWIRIGVLVFVLLGGAVLAVLASAGGDGTHSSSTGEVASDATPPWPPSYEDLPGRVAALGFPPTGDESFHIHAQLHVYANGDPITVPGNIGFDIPGRFESPLHTHDPNGVVHIEADSPFPFKLRDFFVVWGVAFSESQLGGYHSNSTDHIYVSVNGAPAEDGPDHVLQDGDNIVVAYGAEGSFPLDPLADGLPRQ